MIVCWRMTKLIRTRSRREARARGSSAASRSSNSGSRVREKPTHAAMRNRIVSATRPGPNAMAQPLVPGAASRISRSSTNITVPDDMLPKSLSTPRETASAVGGNSRACFHRIQYRASARMHRPQIDRCLVAEQGGARAGQDRCGWRRVPRRTAPCRNPARGYSSGSARRCPGTSAALNESIRTPTGSAEMSAAAQPSPNSRKDRISSRSVVSCKCKVHSSRFIASTRAPGSERTIWRASFNALIAA